MRWQWRGSKNYGSVVDTPPPLQPCPTPGDVNWPPFRFGVEIKGLFSDAMTPLLSPDGTSVPQSMSSERILFAGSLWCLDVKRYLVLEDGSESVAVYLRRRGLRTWQGGGGGGGGV